MSRFSDGEKMKCLECEQPTLAIYMLIPKDEGRHEKRVLIGKRYCMNCDKVYSTKLTMVID